MPAWRTGEAEVRAGQPDAGGLCAAHRSLYAERNGGGGGRAEAVARAGVDGGCGARIAWSSERGENLLRFQRWEEDTERQRL